MIFHHEPLTYYVDRLWNREYFSFAGFSDAEWFCILHYTLGRRTGLGQILHGPTGDRLADVLLRRAHDSRFLIAVPDCFWTLAQNYPKNIQLSSKIEDWLQAHSLFDINFWERDTVLDGPAERAELQPLIYALQHMPTVFIGNSAHRDLTFLNNDLFIEIDVPNFHLVPGGIERAIGEALSYALSYGKPAVYLVSAGVSAALIIDALHDRIPDSTFIDCGSIWDAFVGIGSQRTWRQKLYSDPVAWEQWKQDNLLGKTEQMSPNFYECRLAEASDPRVAVWSGAEAFWEQAKQESAEICRQYLQPGMKVLDAGCGIGELVECLPPGIHYLGIDFCPGFVQKAKERYPDRAFEVCDLRDLSRFTDKEFDIVILRTMEGTIKRLSSQAWESVLRGLHRIGQQVLYFQADTTNPNESVIPGAVLRTATILHPPPQGFIPCVF
jgi:SAM-dependent methyltransferase